MSCLRNGLAVALARVAAAARAESLTENGARVDVALKITKVGVLALFLLTVAPLRALSANDTPLPASAMADKVLVLKGERKLLLMKGNEVLKTYSLSL